MKKRLLFLVSCLGVFNTCFALDWQGLHEKADNQSLTQASMAVQLHPESPENNYLLGLAYLNQHKDKAAEGIFKKILEMDPGITEARWGLAESLRRQHKLDEAEKLLNAVLEEEPAFYPALISLAYLRYIRMDFRESARLALIVIRAGRGKADLSNYTRAYCVYAGSKGMIAHYAGPFSKLINGLAVKRNLDKAEELQPNSAGVLFGLGSFYLLAPRIAGGDKDKSEFYLKKAAKIDPDFADAYARLAQLYKSKGEEALFNKFLNRALEIDSANELALDTKSGRCKYICAGGED